MSEIRRLGQFAMIRMQQHNQEEGIYQASRPLNLRGFPDE